MLDVSPAAGWLLDAVGIKYQLRFVDADEIRAYAADGSRVLAAGVRDQRRGNSGSEQPRSHTSVATVTPSQSPTTVPAKAARPQTAASPTGGTLPRVSYDPDFAARIEFGVDASPKIGRT